MTNDQKLARSLGGFYSLIARLDAEHAQREAMQKEAADLTAQAMAEAFWAMPNTQQVKFFEHLARVIQKDAETNSSAAALGCLQWHWVAFEMEGNQLARDMLQTMAAPLYLHTLRAADKLKGAA